MKKKMKKLHDETVHHLEEDIHGYEKEIKDLKHEIFEDKALIRKFLRKPKQNKK